MAKEFFDYDPVRGVTSWYDYDESTDTAYILQEQDKKMLQGVKDYVAEIRNTGASDQRWKDSEMAFYCVIPPQVELELLAKGINIHDRNCTKILLETINRDYPWLKATNKVHVANA